MNNLTILFVEDEASVREELGYFLKRLAKGGVYLAENGREGLELYRRYRPDIVVSDLEMPGMHGLEMIAEIRRIDPSQPIIVTTAHSESHFLIQAIEMKIDHFLFKPIDLENLKEKILKISHNLLLEKQLEEQRLVMEEIAQFESNMLIVLDRGMRPIFLNRALLEFFGVDSLEDYVRQDVSIARHIVEQEEGFVPSEKEGFAWVNELESLEPSRRIIALKHPRKETLTVYNVALSYNPETGHRIIALSEITELASKHKFYKRHARIDELTGLFNRFAFNQALEKRIRKAWERGSSLCLIIFDLDHFKRINDRYGHAVGDEILKEIGRFLQRSLGPGDFLARWGGEEFAVISDRGLEGTLALAEEIRRRLHRTLFERGIALHCSCGVACQDPHRGPLNAELLFRQADKALYRAKNEGRDRVVAFDGSKAEGGSSTRFDD